MNWRQRRSYFQLEASYTKKSFEMTLERRLKFDRQERGWEGFLRRQEEPVSHGQEWQAVQCIPRGENLWKNIVGYKIGDRQSRSKCQARVFGHVSDILGTKQVHFSELCRKRAVWTWVCEMTWRKDSSWKNLVKQYGWSTEGELKFWRWLNSPRKRDISIEMLRILGRCWQLDSGGKQRVASVEDK